MENLYYKNCIRTFSGKYVDPFEIDPSMICIEDIAHALAHQCRFAGHLPVFYSVAEHSITCWRHASPENKLAALLHDASEAYLLDIPRPVKHRLPGYKEVEQKVMSAIAKVFGFQYPFVNEIKEIDEKMLVFEWETFMLGAPPFGKSRDAKVVKSDFLEIYNLIVNP